MAIGQNLPESDSPEIHTWLAELQAILNEQSLYSVYQPIVSLESGTIVGYEALTRGPEGSPLHAPVQLFGLAERYGCQYALDKLAREKAIRGFRPDFGKQLLFINISSHIISDPHFTPGQTLVLLEQHGLQPHNIVFEITERSSIEDFSLTKKILQHYRNQGYRIAIDDAGAGYSSLQAIAELHPDFIKVDRSLIENIHQDKIKECILETFVTFTRKLNIGLITEGIEHPEELAKLARMGVQYAQGFLLAKPAREPALIPPDIIDPIVQNRKSNRWSDKWTIGDLAAPIQQFDKTALVSDAAEYFKNEPQAPAAVVVSEDRPIGLVMRDRLFQKLAGQYSFSLFWNRTVEQVMDRQPLIVDESAPIELVSQLATSRRIDNYYDLVIVTKDGRMVGAATIRSILESITNIRIESARVANPLTGLPGNLQINRELRKRLADKVSFSVIYLDLDFFKWFNDRFGFQKGDQLIQYTADTVQQAIAVCGTPYDFVGHVGGDDFIVMTLASKPERLCGEMIRRYDCGVTMFYEEEELNLVEDRYGNKIDTDGVTLSLALVECDGGAAVTPEQISQVSADLKKQAKSYRNSSFVSRRLGSKSD